MLTPAELLHYVEEAVLWKPESNGFTVWLDQSTSAFVSKEEVDALDRRLYPVICAMIEARSDGQYGPEVLGPVVAETYSEWQTPSLVFDDRAAGPIHMADITDITRMADGSGAVLIGTCRELGDVSITLDGETKTLPCVNRSYKLHGFAREDWMNTHYPGWETRLAALDAIGYTGIEKVALVMTHQASLPAVDMTEVRFD